MSRWRMSQLGQSSLGRALVALVWAEVSFKVLVVASPLTTLAKVTSVVCPMVAKEIECRV
jgi:hypothetical protein